VPRHRWESESESDNRINAGRDERAFTCMHERVIMMVTVAVAVVVVVVVVNGSVAMHTYTDTRVGQGIIV